MLLEEPSALDPELVVDRRNPIPEARTEHRRPDRDPLGGRKLTALAAGRWGESLRAVWAVRPL
jgi:hypothetical protein